MKIYLMSFIISLLFSALLNAQDKTEEVKYEMKTYYMAFLMKGPNRDQDSTTAQQIQQAHMDHINKMAEDKKLVIAGPFLDDGDIRGIFIFNVETMEEAIALTEADPAVKAGRLIMEIHPWWGAKGSCLE
mgnify:FL=1